MRPTRYFRNLRFLYFGLIVEGIAALLFTSAVRAQDSFEIRVEQYEQPVWGGFTLEEHLNDVGIGSNNFDGTVDPTNHQFHMSSELTGGITQHFSVGLMLMTAVVPRVNGLEYAGWRVLPHVYAPDYWNLPVKVGLTAEFSFQRPAFDESTATLELRPVLERTVGRFQIDLNPSIEKSLTGLPVRAGWRFEPSFRIAYAVSPRFSPSLEYFSAVGQLANLLPIGRQVHQIFPGGDLKLARNLEWNFGIGIGLTAAGNRLVYKTRLEFSFGRKPRSRS